ncbi:MAG: hypothetical protein QOD99_333 [Chthoniobacter sp.]|jgi:3-oxoacyl-(acyl-carrier-protein) synthase|nr:hypothetical protein [Chthoniobacter sp.]
MTAHIQGMGWITPLGADLDEVWQRVMNGDLPEARELAGSDADRKHFYVPVPQKLVESLARNPRLRRSSAISYFAAAAGLAALENAGIKMTPEVAAKTAVVFAIASGGVVYTRKFYEQIVKQGANSASPLLFPETVYNAPASHLAALLGVDGASYTLVGDASVGVAALKLAEQLLATTEVEYCVVIGAEEVDWVLCEAYREWRLVTSRPQIEIGSNRGTLLAEGAAALVLGRTGDVALRRIHNGGSFFNRRQAREAISRVHRELDDEVTTIVCSANGTFIDKLESAAIELTRPGVHVLKPKAHFGEALGAGALQQTIAGVLGLARSDADAALISVLGFNQQASGVVITRASR